MEGLKLRYAESTYLNVTMNPIQQIHSNENVKKHAHIHQVYNLSYLGGGDQEDHRLRTARSKS
jgi:hypothetical protein